METELLTRSLNCWTGAKLNVKYFFPSWLTEATSPFVTRCLKALREDAGLQVETGVWRFSTDGVYPAGELGVLTVGLGPGDEELAHQPNEYVNLNQVKLTVKAYKALIREFTGLKEESH